MKKFIWLLSLSLAFLFFSGCESHAPEQEFSLETVFDTFPVSNTTPESLNAYIAISDEPGCLKIPTQADVNNGKWSYTDHFYTASQALKIGIPVVNINGSRDLRVYVKDYRRVATCSGHDSITVLYGQIIRTVIEIENYDASVGVDLASIAANGTLKKNSQHFYFYKDGFYNPKIDSIIISVQGKEFDVQNYTLFQNVMGEVINLLVKSGTTFSPARIGVQGTLGDEQEELAKSPVITFALSAIASGTSCSRAKKKFLQNRFACDLVEQTYRALECQPDDTKPAQEAMAKAKKLLQGVKAK